MKKRKIPIITLNTKPKLVIKNKAMKNKITVINDMKLLSISLIGDNKNEN